MKNDTNLQKNSLKLFKSSLKEQFNSKANIITITHKLVSYIDTLLIFLFDKNGLSLNNDFCLIAIGGYGRRELSLYSDVDILLLHKPQLSKIHLKNAQNFVQDCWDYGLEISHQITTVENCSSLASQDISVISSLMDHFLLCGRGVLLEELLYHIHPLQMWNSKKYFQAKIKEQQVRERKYSETAYNLEPNIKFGVGGLRDIHILSLISKRHFNINKLAEGIAHGFLTEKEYEQLMYCLHFLWRVRFALHSMADKAEERLSFDYQIKLAHFFEYQDKPHSLAIEQFMKDYFQVLKRTHEMNEMLLQWFAETIAESTKQRLIHLDNEFQLANHFIEVKNIKLFSEHPQAILKLFYWIAIRPEIDGVRASTIRLIKQSLHLIDSNFKTDPENTRLFLNILKAGEKTYSALQFMSRYGVLAHYIDCFAAISGQMQYDLFHVFTVDQHTLFVIRNISRFFNNEFAQQFSLAHQLIHQLTKIEILYLSALFHDIAKGRGGDHSELGAIEAKNFAFSHCLSTEDTELLIWLVANHLLMSQTAQRQDIYDPLNIKNFKKKLPKASYLDYLYLLTVADICGTNPNLWNAWKDSLLKELYRATKQFLKEEQQLMDKNLLIAEKKQNALSILSKSGLSQNAVDNLWKNFKDKYFLHESPNMIARHTQAILNNKNYPLVMILPHHTQGGTEVFIYNSHLNSRFTIATSVLCNHHVTIQEAMILSCTNNFDLDTYIILNENNQPLVDEKRILAIQEDLCFHLNQHNSLPVVTQRRLPRTLTYFKVNTEINFSDDIQNNYTRLFLETGDRPGLLAAISRVFLKFDILLHNAKIVTAGERAEDMFYISNQNHQILNALEKDLLKTELLTHLISNQSER